MTTSEKRPSGPDAASSLDEAAPPKANPPMEVGPPAPSPDRPQDSKVIEPSPESVDEFGGDATPFGAKLDFEEYLKWDKKLASAIGQVPSPVWITALLLVLAKRRFVRVADLQTAIAFVLHQVKEQQSRIVVPTAKVDPKVVSKIIKP